MVSTFGDAVPLIIVATPNIDALFRTFKLPLFTLDVFSRLLADEIEFEIVFASDQPMSPTTDGLMFLDDANEFMDDYLGGENQKRN